MIDTVLGALIAQTHLHFITSVRRVGVVGRIMLLTFRDDPALSVITGSFRAERGLERDWRCHLPALKETMATGCGKSEEKMRKHSP